MAVQTAQLRTVLRRVLYQDHVSPTRAGLFSEYDLAVRRCINRLTTVGVPACGLVPVLAQVPVLAEILSVVPIVPPIVFLSHVIFLADRIGETPGSELEEEQRYLLARVLRR